VLASYGDPEWQRSFGLLPGYDWSERTMGTNGAGTALASVAATVVMGPEHFVAAFEDCTCVAAPVRDPTGQLIGAIDLSTAFSDGNAERTGLMAYAALMVERDLVHAEGQVEWTATKRLAAELSAREEELRQTNERLQVILDNAPVLIYLVDETNRFLNANKAWLRLSGLREASVIGRSLYDVFEKETAARFEANNRVVLEAQGPQSFEEAYEGRTYLSVKVPVHDAQGRSYAICGMSVDITERKQAEAVLRESEERFRVMADSLPLIVWVHGPNGEQEFVNQTFCEFFGVAREEMRGDRWQAVLHPDEGPAYVAEFARCVRDRRPFHAQTRVQRADGDWRWIESWGRPRFSPTGEFLGFVGSSADITERRATDQKLLESEAALRNADQKKNEFIATLGHELRNPLAAIRNATHILHLAPSNTAGVVAIVERQVGHLVRLVDDLLDISRITLGKMTFERQVLDIRAVVQDAVVATESEIHKAGHRFSFNSPDDPVLVEGDRVRLCQVVANLLSNAARYTPEPGDIRLEIRNAGEDTVIVSVEDSGIGLSADEIAVLFHPFTQTERAATLAHGGLGIGLALVKSIVEAHGGLVDVSSAGKDQGSRFVVRLPLAADQPSSLAP
jgi:PAS domain S-box-containing protein